MAIFWPVEVLPRQEAGRSRARRGEIHESVALEANPCVADGGDREQEEDGPDE